ncbi:MAG: ATP-binding protein, partial [Candidatus Omnitrophica bacterium]|nr:ATP-binding protein [Candidatus Omnitrophota bacterium]
MEREGAPLDEAQAQAREIITELRLQYQVLRTPEGFKKVFKGLDEVDEDETAASIAQSCVLRPVAKEERQAPRDKSVRGLVKPNWSAVSAKFRGYTHTSVINTCTVCVLTGGRSIGMAHINPGTTLAILDKVWRIDKRVLTPEQAKEILLEEAFSGMFPALTNERWNKVLILSRANVGQILAARKRKALAGFIRRRKGKAAKALSVEELVADYMVTAQDIKDFLTRRLGEDAKKVDMREGRYDCGLSGAAVILRSDDIAEYRPYLMKYLQNRSNVAAYFDLANASFDLLLPSLPERIAKAGQGSLVYTPEPIPEEHKGVNEEKASVSRRAPRDFDSIIIRSDEILRREPGNISAQITKAEALIGRGNPGDYQQAEGILKAVGLQQGSNLAISRLLNRMRRLTAEASIGNKPEAAEKEGEKVTARRTEENKTKEEAHTLPIATTPLGIELLPIRELKKKETKKEEKKRKKDGEDEEAPKVSIKIPALDNLPTVDIRADVDSLRRGAAKAKGLPHDLLEYLARYGVAPQALKARLANKSERALRSEPVRAELMEFARDAFPGRIRREMKHLLFDRKNPCVSDRTNRALQQFFEKGIEKGLDWKQIGSIMTIYLPQGFSSEGEALEAIFALSGALDAFFESRQASPAAGPAETIMPDLGAAASSVLRPRAAGELRLEPGQVDSEDMHGNQRQSVLIVSAADRPRDNVREAGSSHTITLGAETVRVYYNVDTFKRISGILSAAREEDLPALKVELAQGTLRILAADMKRLKCAMLELEARYNVDLTAYTYEERKRADYYDIDLDRDIRKMLDDLIISLEKGLALDNIPVDARSTYFVDTLCRLFVMRPKWGEISLVDDVCQSIFSGVPHLPRGRIEDEFMQDRLKTMVDMYYLSSYLISYVYYAVVTGWPADFLFSYDYLRSSFSVVVDRAQRNCVREERAVKISTDFKMSEELRPGHRLRYACNPNLLNIAIDEYLKNAIQSGARNILVGMRAGENGDITISISDDGRGMDPDIIGKIEMLGYTTAGEFSAYVLGGYGLGMYKARAIASFHNARLKITSVPDEGTTVNLILPPERGSSPSHETGATLQDTAGAESLNSVLRPRAAGERTQLRRTAAATDDIGDYGGPASPAQKDKYIGEAAKQLYSQTMELQKLFRDREYMEIFDEMEDTLEFYYKKRREGRVSYTAFLTRLREMVDMIKGRWIRMSPRVKKSADGKKFALLRSGTLGLSHQVELIIEHLEMDRQRAKEIEARIKENRDQLNQLLWDTWYDFAKKGSAIIYDYIKLLDPIERCRGVDSYIIEVTDYGDDWSERVLCLIYQCVQINTQIQDKISNRVEPADYREGLGKYSQDIEALMESLYRAWDRDIALQFLYGGEYAIYIPVPNDREVIRVTIRSMDPATDSVFGKIAVDRNRSSGKPPDVMWDPQRTLCLTGSSRRIVEFAHAISLFDYARYSSRYFSSKQSDEIRGMRGRVSYYSRLLYALPILFERFFGNAVPSPVPQPSLQGANEALISVLRPRAAGEREYLFMRDKLYDLFNVVKYNYKTFKDIFSSQEIETNSQAWRESNYSRQKNISDFNRKGMVVDRYKIAVANSGRRFFTSLVFYTQRIRFFCRENGIVRPGINIRVNSYFQYLNWDNRTGNAFMNFIRKCYRTASAHRKSLDLGTRKNKGTPAYLDFAFCTIWRGVPSASVYANPLPSTITTYRPPYFVTRYSKFLLNQTSASRTLCFLCNINYSFLLLKDNTD